jgi:hypothetical protein
MQAYGKQAVKIRVADVENYDFIGALSPKLGETIVYRLDDRYTEMIDDDSSKNDLKDEL